MKRAKHLRLTRPITTLTHLQTHGEADGATRIEFAQIRQSVERVTVGRDGVVCRDVIGDAAKAKSAELFIGE
jgi:hypothetical protein